MKFIVDIQGFQSTNEFIVKELSIIKIVPSLSSLFQYNRNDVECILFQPPYPWINLSSKFKSTNLWLIHNHHGIPWNAGDIPYDQLHEIVHNKLKSATYIFVKGLEKKKWLAQNFKLSSNIINLEDLGCPALNILRVSTCTFFNYHRRVLNHQCASETGRKLRMWFWEKFGYGPSFNRSLMLLQQSHYGLRDMDTEDIPKLTAEFLLAYQSKNIESVWDKLPKSFQRNPKIAACRLCFKHWPKAIEGSTYDVIDGPPPMIKNCISCLKK